MTNDKRAVEQKIADAMNAPFGFHLNLFNIPLIIEPAAFFVV